MKIFVIEDIAGNVTEVSEKIYTLDGRMIKGSTMQKGIYIIGGRKVIVK